MKRADISNRLGASLGGIEMTPLETLAKYGLKTDVKSIRERVFLNVEKRFSYSEFLIKWLQNIHGVHVQIPIDSDFRHAWEEIKNADLALLCSLAEKGERENKLLELYRQFFKETNINIGLDDCDIDDFSSTFEYVDIENDKAEVDTVKRIQELEAEGEGK